MKNFLAICIFCLTAVGYSQDKQPTYSVEGDLVKATYYYDNGAIKTQGYFKDKKLTGEWVRFDKSGNKKQIAYYDNGKKVGKWFVWSKETLKEINYQNNAVVNVNVWKSSEIKVAANK
ncbi:nicotinic acid mononucleotide adenyltransferase [Polaribacter sp. MSW13]|uniref:Nicotinic acid mononucleotide adenyltransferase n=1 Tax=Polaribacter marinus TaxID=2916838 RepID=A0A9X2AJT1_9FLAO|nr:nicotinic acid mononucleotide adenyltransferase [Polaribacter marinus]MCI2229347.1 nicotinic acid mononucleotide adenyltransferase [Polaribacter marinus]